MGGEDERPLEVLQQKDQGLGFRLVRVLVFANRGGYDTDCEFVDGDVNLLPDRRCRGDVADGILMDIRLILE